MKKETEEERQKRIEKLAKQIHPHDDEPDPTATWETIIFPNAIRFLRRFCTMFVLAVDEINDFKGCPFPEYFNEPRTNTTKSP